MTSPDVVIMGLPESGKTTYLAALWHLLNDDRDELQLSLASLGTDDRAYLNAIQKRWSQGKVQERTNTYGLKTVSMQLCDGNGNRFSITLPDLPGETYRDIWEQRDCDIETITLLTTPCVLLFIHSEKINHSETQGRRAEAIGPQPNQLQSSPTNEWRPSNASTQVKIVDLLQLLRRAPLDIGPRKLAIIISAWDIVKSSNITPCKFLHTNLPLLDQYLQSNADQWETKIYGVSAQGGIFSDQDEVSNKTPAEVELGTSYIYLSDRIEIIGGEGSTYDLTSPIAWLMQPRIEV
ncbi:hypothetical protein [Chromobacterium sp. Beijing]|uniref:TRAFAC clade GTPase domain-containing protein n=1 Tax=Chromobacterium sp. Beijing TaxID=2735795 RepID=UPI001F26F799|nr:hypothetical protein [Chromobacterium sp. Beijing]UJB33414.1 hypothetical protein HQN78_21500 [Chromobacterium sp. Beijing]